MFQKGKSGNIHGRPKGSRDFGTELVAAIKRAEKRDKESLLDYAVRRARASDKVLCSLLSKVVPDLSINDIPALREFLVNISVTKTYKQNDS
ncbi:MAG: hypothetical protein PHG53_09480 [Phycisphaerae bacterium]|nr:hypothetical protein [Phycisphaerae bacterium]